MGFGVPLSQNHHVHGARKMMAPKSFPTGSTHAVAINGALEMTLRKDEAEA